ncbi:TPA: hypothetical protein I8N27_003374 [Salmonella enterica subsp. enterica serovar Derby]|nr:hypothetical protein [Salmonella enterica subsp. enterica serovar Derby]HAS9766252.1 hypothetical protein [Salmonella enterica subsp. enterica serovar Derby]
MSHTRPRVDKKVREKAIEHFKSHHGNHSHEVIVGIDVEKMKETAKNYKGRVNLADYGIAE